MQQFPALDAAHREALLAPRAGRVDLVIDTDAGNEIDDQFTVAWALRRSDRLRLLGLLACPFGITPELLASGTMLAELDARKVARRLAAMGAGPDAIPRFDAGDGMRVAVRELETLVALAGADCPVHPGSTRYLGAFDTPPESPAVRFLIESAHAPREGPLYVAAIGCATNVAAALLCDPTLVGRIVVVWVAAYPSFWPHRNASYNLAQDVRAAQVLLDSGVPLVYVPGYYVAEELRSTREETARFLAGRGPLADHLDALHEAHARKGSGAVQSKVLWDLAALAWILEPAWFTTHVVPTPRLTEDLRWIDAESSRPLMLEAVDLDRDAIFADFYGCFGSREADG